MPEVRWLVAVVPWAQSAGLSESRGLGATPAGATAPASSEQSQPPVLLMRESPQDQGLRG